MRFLHTYHIRWTNPFKVLWFLLWYQTPDQSKRLCVLASLYARLTECNEDDTERLQQINEAFGLSRDPRALRFPTLLAPWIWSSVIPFNRVDLTSDPEHYIARLLKKTPCWLWYADAETRREDIRRLVELCSGRTLATV